MNLLARRILDALPQTQCTRCGYPDCEGYAEAITDGQAHINQCPPGGAEGVTRLSGITGQPLHPLDPAFGIEGPRQVAFIDENWCIGCTLCLDACPTDAIVGSNKLMHTVIEAHCTGCELCIPACPVDCILLEPASDARTGWAAWSQAQADAARARYAMHKTRMCETPRSAELESAVAAALDVAPSPAEAPGAAAPTAAEERRSAVQAAMARARALRGAKPTGD